MLGNRVDGVAPKCRSLSWIVQEGKVFGENFWWAFWTQLAYGTPASPGKIGRSGWEKWIPVQVRRSSRGNYPRCRYALLCAHGLLSQSLTSQMAADPPQILTLAAGFTASTLVPAVGNFFFLIKFGSSLSDVLESLDESKSRGKDRLEGCDMLEGNSVNRKFSTPQVH